jgi:hypothetical protein
MMLFLSCAAVGNSSAQVSNYKAYTLFVYNFTKYIQWPEGAIKDEFIIGVFGKSPIQDELQKMVALKKAGDKTIRIVELSESNLMSEVHILFIPDDKTGQMTTILAALKGKPVLLVAEKEGTVSKGAGISFMSDHNNLKFELNASSIATQNLKVSKTLEALAFKSTSL